MTDLMQKIAALARCEGAERVVRVAVSLGALSHMSPEHFREHFEHAAAGTPAEGATVDVLLSTDLDDDHANSILLRSIDVES